MVFLPRSRLNEGEPSMTSQHSTPAPPVLVAIDIAKLKHDVLVELPDGRRQKMIVRNQLPEFRRLADYLRSLGRECLIAFEPTADYHRCLAYFLGSQGFELRLASSLYCAHHPGRGRRPAPLPS